ncbi:MAG: DUF1311 domain-containing protein [Alteromonadaceae bacterium]|nr:DUF1311 domain-containing protein [Alteromonadaceae bacterium]
MINKRLLLLSALFLAFNVSAQNLSLCLQKAQTQFEMNQCEGINLAAVNTELARVMARIQSVYKASSPELLAELELSHKAWQASLQANLAMKFPLQDKRLNYGSVYPMCASAFEAKLVAQRIEFLKEWTVGVEEGEVCSGSVLSEYFLRSDCGNND